MRPHGARLELCGSMRPIADRSSAAPARPSSTAWFCPAIAMTAVRSAIAVEADPRTLTIHASHRLGRGTDRTARPSGSIVAPPPTSRTEDARCSQRASSCDHC